MTLDQETCYRVLAARDARYDGMFYVGVSSTGIYCRCVCPAKCPKQENCLFFNSPAEAEDAGYRPCLRCRPENAPGRASVDATKSTARRAARLIENGALDAQSLEELAGTLQISGRQLRRSFKSELGVSPVQLAQTVRLLTAKKLLTDSSLGVAEIAMASGFRSLRRFNDVFQTRYRMSPSNLRRQTGRRKQSMVVCQLSYRPPYAWDQHLAFLRQRQIEGVEFVDQNSYSRSVRMGAHVGWLRVSNAPLRNWVSIQITDTLAPVLPKLLRRLRRVFDLDADPLAIHAVLGELGKDNPGLRVPGAFDGFEAAVRAILGQQVTVGQATKLAGRFAAAFGEEVDTDMAEVPRIFPSAETIASFTPAEIAQLGIVGSRAAAIVDLAQAIASKRLVLSAATDYESARQGLLCIKGVGPWTADYVAMRALGHPDAFPVGDVAVLKALGTRNVADAARAVEMYRPWRSYAVMHLWQAAGSVSR